VDAIISIGDNIDLVRDTKYFFSKAFDMKDIGLVHYSLHIEGKRDRKHINIYLSKKKFTENIPNEFGVEICKVVKTHFQVRVKLSIEMFHKSH